MYRVLRYRKKLHYKGTSTYQLTTGGEGRVLSPSVIIVSYGGGGGGGGGSKEGKVSLKENYPS